MVTAPRVQRAMIIENVRIECFRSAKKVSLDLGGLTALVGPNGSGKSTLIRALDVFYSPAPVVTQDDFFAGNVSSPIQITVTFGGLSTAAQGKFAPYLDAGKLTLTRQVKLVDGKAVSTLHGSRMQNPDFSPVRDALASDGKAAARDAYAQLRRQVQYSGLPSARSAEDCVQALRTWEEANPGRCTRQRDDGQFFGFKEVGLGYLGEFTQFILVPAVRDAFEEGSDGRGSTISQILDLVVRSRVETNDEYRRFVEETGQRYEELMARPETREELARIESDLSTTLGDYVPNAKVRLQWITEGGVRISLPKADVRLVEDAYVGPVNRSGHGLQRAFILSMLQQLAAARLAGRAGGGGTTGVPEPAPDAAAAPPAPSSTLPSLLLAIEEPELYQHPNRQRFLARVLLGLAGGGIPNVTGACQVLYATHSPLFVGIDRFDSTRVVRKAPPDGTDPRKTTVSQTTMGAVAEKLWEACERSDAGGRPIDCYQGASLRPRLYPIMTPWMAEGFFASLVVLVEGEGDCAALEGAARSLDLDFEGAGISVIPAMGKNNLDRPGLIFQALGIPTYLVWDCDQGNPQGVRPNRILQHVAGVAQVVDCPGTEVSERHATLEMKLESLLRQEIGSEYDEILESCRIDLGYESRQDAEKNSRVIADVVTRSRERGLRSTTMEQIVQKIWAAQAG